MARTNKYTSLNFNDIYEKKTTTSAAANNHRPSSLLTTLSGNKTVLSNSRIHGNMLVLSVPSPKPVVPPPQPSPPPSPAAAAPPADHPRNEVDAISLRPLGRTGSGPPLGQNRNSPVSPKTNKFVPPHLRPGFLGREERPGSEFQKQTGSGFRSNLRQGSFVPPSYHGEEGRPKSGGGYERMRSGFEIDPMGLNRSRSIKSTRPSSSG